MNVLFDLDGTLTDPREGILACMRHGIEGVGAVCPSDDQLERFIGPPLLESLRSVIGDDSRAGEALIRYRERFSAAGMFENRLYPGVPEALGSIRTAGARLFLATSKPLIYARDIVHHFDLGGFFDGLYGSELDGTRTNKRDLIAHLVGCESIDPARTCMVGDREHDVLGARGNGVHAIGALWGYGSREELIAAGADEICESVAMLPAVVSQFYRKNPVTPLP